MHPTKNRRGRTPAFFLLLTTCSLLHVICHAQEGTAPAVSANVSHAEQPANAQPLSPYTSETARTLANSLPGRGSALPLTLFPREKLEENWRKLAADPAAQAKTAALRAKVEPYLSIPSERWEELLPDRSPAPVCRTEEEGKEQLGNSSYFRGCPVTGAALKDIFLPFDLVNAPFSVKLSATGETIHEREADMTAQEKARLKGVSLIPHWDGKPRTAAYALAGATFNNKPLFYYPANYVWRERLGAIVGDWARGVVPELTEVYLRTGDERYAQLLLRIMRRLAVILPHLPLACHNGVDPRSREEFLRMAASHIPPGNHGWLGPARLSGGGENFRPPTEAIFFNNLARAFLAIEGAHCWGDNTEDAKAAREEIRKGLLGEAALLLSAYGSGNMFGNGIGMYAPALLTAGIVFQDRYYFDGFNRVLEEFLYTEAFYDGISTEGSLNYAGMVGGMYGLWNVRREYDPDCLRQHPFFTVCGRSQEHLRSQCGVLSQHGDGPNLAWPYSAGALRKADAPAQEQAGSASFAGFGITVLRAGGQGQRLEVFFHHDRVTGHAHPDMLGLQVHYRGVPIMNHLGDARMGNFLELRPSHNSAAPALQALAYPHPMRPTDDLVGYKHWSWGLHASQLTKNTLLIDEYDYGFGRAPWRGGFGKAKEPSGNLRAIDLTDPAFQIVEADAEGVAPLHYQGVRDFRRTLLLVTRPGGRPYLADFFHASGGNRQMMVWHSPGEVTQPAFPAAQPAGTLASWLDQTFPDRTEWYSPVCRLNDAEQLRNLRVQASPPVEWQQVWRYAPAAYAPKTAPAGQSSLTAEAWGKLGCRPVCVSLRAATLPGEPLTWGMQATSDFPTIIDETVDGRRQNGMVRFIDGLNYVATMRVSNQRLSSTFAHVLEPYADGEKQEIFRVQPLQPRDGERQLPSGVAGVRVVFTDGSVDLLAVIPESCAEYTFRLGLHIRGRFALVRLNPAGEVTDWRLSGGGTLSWQGRVLTTSAGGELRAPLLSVRGDLSGDRQTSELLVRPDTNWPSADQLSGKQVRLICNNGRRVESYWIKQAIMQSEGNFLRLILHGAPPFVDLWGEVKTLYNGSKQPQDPQQANEFTGSAAYKGGMFSTPYLDGSRLAFPELGLEFTLRSGEHRSWRFDLAEPVNLREAGVCPGTRYAVYPDLRGAEVRILLTKAPGHAAIQH